MLVDTICIVSQYIKYNIRVYYFLGYHAEKYFPKCLQCKNYIGYIGKQSDIMYLTVLICFIYKTYYVVNK